MTFKQGVSGNPHGNRHHSRHLLNQEFIQALLLHFREHGKKAMKVAREHPAAYMKILLALLVPREMKIEHTDPVKGLSDEQLEAMISHLEERIARRTDQAKLIEGQAAEITALPAPVEVPKPKRRNRVMAAADTAVLGRDEP
jgi:hypothetical protein